MSFEIQRINYPIDLYVQQLDNEKYSFPDWQREDCWKDNYKKELIVSILKGMDLPKIYLGDIKEKDKVYIIDGGHRSRAIREFMKNKFSITDGKTEMFYNKTFEKETRNKSILSSSQKKKFDDYHLDIVKYSDITENDCRNIFNKLQNAKPMSIEDVINSWQSELVDFIRNLLDFSLLDDTIFNHFINLKIINKPNKTTIMSQLLSWYTIQYPIMEENPGLEKEMVSLKYLAKGNNNSSPILDYVHTYRWDITDNLKGQFLDLIIFIISYYKQNNISTSDMNTLIHSKVNYSNFNLEKYKELLSQVKEYDLLRKKGEDYQKHKKYEESRREFINAEKINNNYENNLEVWSNSRKDGGNNPSGMKKRLNIIMDYCLN